MRNSSTGKPMTAAGSGYQFVEQPVGTCIGDCCCFLAPNPNFPAWSAITTYNFTDPISHGGNNYYSKVNNNLNHEPPNAAYWCSYNHCDNSDWNSFPPFGGIGKTPKYYALSLMIYGQSITYHVDCELCETLGISADFSYTLCANIKATRTGACTWSWTGILGGSVSWSWVTDDYSCSGTSIPCISGDYHCITLHLFPAIRYGFVFGSFRGADCLIPDDCKCGSYACPEDGEISINDCQISGSMAVKNYYSENTCYGGTCPGGTLFQEFTRDETVSWRPMDCEYTLWNSTTLYHIGDCVVWAGKFYICITTNINQEPPNITYWMDIS